MWIVAAMLRNMMAETCARAWPRHRGWRAGGLALSARLEDGIARLLTRDERIDGRDARRVGSARSRATCVG